MADRSLFGDPLPRRFGRLPGVQQTFGEGAEWMDAARDLAEGGGMRVLQFGAGGEGRGRVLVTCDGLKTPVWQDVVWVEFNGEMVWALRG